HRHDDEAATMFADVATHHDVVVVLFDGAHGRAQNQAATELCGQRARDLLHAAPDAFFLGAAADRDQRVQPATGAEGIEEVEEGYLPRLRGGDGASGEIQEEAPAAGEQIAALPALEGHGVPPARVAGSPRSLVRNLPSVAVESSRRPQQIELGHDAEGQIAVLVTEQAAV